MTTPRISMPELIESQAQKAVTVNDSLRIIDALLQAGVTDRDLTAPPGSPTNGAVYIPAATATGAWAGQEGKLAQWYASSWHFLTPAEGWSVWVIDEQVRITYVGGAWTVQSGSGDFKSDGSVAMTGTLQMQDNVVSRPEIKDYAETRTAPTPSAGTLTLDLTTGNVFEPTLTENVTIAFANPPAAGKSGSVTLVLRQDATGGRSVTWPASVKWAGGTAPTLTTSASAVDVLTFLTTDGGAVWFGFLAGADLK